MVKLSVSVSASVNLDVKTIGIGLSVKCTIGLALNDSMHLTVRYEQAAASVASCL